jgi:hypothetical protein
MRIWSGIKVFGPCGDLSLSLITSFTPPPRLWEANFLLHLPFQNEHHHPRRSPPFEKPPVGLPRRLRHHLLHLLLLPPRLVLVPHPPSALPDGARRRRHGRDLPAERQGEKALEWGGGGCLAGEWVLWEEGGEREGEEGPIMGTGSCRSGCGLGYERVSGLRVFHIR